MGRSGGFNRLLERFAGFVVDWTGGTAAFAVAVLLIALWLVTGPLFDFSDTWQLVINTTTTVVTFLMVFLIQRAQNKYSKAVSLKLNELIAAVEGASNRLIDVEELSEDDLATLHEHFRGLAAMAKRDSSLRASHSVEEAKARHEGKRRARSRPGMPTARRRRG